MMTRVLLIAAAVWIGPVASWAQSFPSKPVRYIVPFGAGGFPDIVARLLGDRLTRLCGQQVTVENRVGVAGVMGTAFVVKWIADGGAGSARLGAWMRPGSDS